MALANCFSCFDLRAINTREITAEDYSRCYYEWGGSFIVHPDVLAFFDQTHGMKVRYRGFFKHGRCIGAVPVWGKFVAGDRASLLAYHLKEKEDFGTPVIYLPIEENHRCAILYKAKHLLSLQRRQISGAIFTRSRMMTVLKKIPDDLLESKRELDRKMRRFERLGGKVRDVQEFGADEIAAIYTDLHLRRWDRKPHAWQSFSRTFSALRDFLFGKILFLEDRPIAIQINYRAETQRTICIDYINGGVDKSLKAISPGTLLSYINGRNACDDSRRTAKQLIYSYGKASDEYKDMWCNSVPRGVSGYWLP